MIWDANNETFLLTCFCFTFRVLLSDVGFNGFNGFKAACFSNSNRPDFRKRTNSWQFDLTIFLFGCEQSRDFLHLTWPLTWTRPDQEHRLTYLGNLISETDQRFAFCQEFWTSCFEVQQHQAALSVYRTWELISSRRSRRIASRRRPTTALSTRKQLSLAWTQRWQRWSRTVCHTQDTRSLKIPAEKHITVKVIKVTVLSNTALAWNIYRFSRTIRSIISKQKAASSSS